MTDDERLEAAIREHAPSEWSEFETEGIVRQVLDLDKEQREDAEVVAEALWSMGAQGPKHRGCRVEWEGNYRNECGPCEKFLVALAEKIIRTSASSHPETEPK